MLTAKIQSTLKDAAKKLTGSVKRAFIAKVTEDYFDGSARKAESHLGWSRKTIHKGQKELSTGFVCIDNYAARGRKKTEEKLPQLTQDIHDLVQGQSQVDPTFRSPLCYARISARAVRKALTHGSLIFIGVLRIYNVLYFILLEDLSIFLIVFPGLVSAKWAVVHNTIEPALEVLCSSKLNFQFLEVNFQNERTVSPDTRKRICCKGSSESANHRKCLK